MESRWVLDIGISFHPLLIPPPGLLCVAARRACARLAGQRSIKNGELIPFPNDNRCDGRAALLCRRVCRLRGSAALPYPRGESIRLSVRIGISPKGGVGRKELNIYGCIPI